MATGAILFRMRIRTIKPEFFTHEGIFEAEQEFKMPLRIAFVGLWCAADREGRFRWEPRRLGVQILPYDLIDFSRVLDALTTRGFIEKHREGQSFFGVIPSFLNHQVINNRERPSELPSPTEISICDACPTRAPRVPHASKAEWKGREGNMEGKGKGTREALCAYAVQIQLQESDGNFLFEHFEETGWKRGKEQIKDWQATMRKWKAGGWLPSQKSNRSSQQKPNPTKGLQENIPFL